MINISKESYRDQIKNMLYDSLIKGKIKLGQKLSLAEYGRILNTSVTPIREAFTQLEQVGILESIPNVGFCVKNVSIQEAKQIYELIGHLEEYSIKKNPYSPNKIKKLKKICLQTERLEQPESKIKMDNLFHDELNTIENNHITQRILKNLKTQVYLFELQFMVESEMTIKSTIDHKQIIDALEKGKLEEAARLNKEHWMMSFEFISNKIT